MKATKTYHLPQLIFEEKFKTWDIIKAETDGKTVRFQWKDGREGVVIHSVRSNKPRIWKSESFAESYLRMLEVTREMCSS